MAAQSPPQRVFRGPDHGNEQRRDHGRAVLDSECPSSTGFGCARAGSGGRGTAGFEAFRDPSRTLRWRRHLSYHLRQPGKSQLGPDLRTGERALGDSAVRPGALPIRLSRIQSLRAGVGMAALDGVFFGRTVKPKSFCAVSRQPGGRQDVRHRRQGMGDGRHPSPPSRSAPGEIGRARQVCANSRRKRA